MQIGKILTIGSIIVWGYKKTNTSFQKIFPFRAVPIYIFLPITLVIIGLSFLMSDVNNLLGIALHATNTNGFIGRYNIWNSLLVTAIITSVSEEFLFRGLILNGFVNNYSLKNAIWISALFFAIFHFNLSQFLPLFIRGLFYAWLVVKTKSLWPSLYSNMLANITPIIITHILKIPIPGYNNIVFHHNVVMQPIWFDGIGLALLIFGIWWLWPLLHGKLILPTELLREPIPVEETTNIHTSKQGVISFIIATFSIMLLIIATIVSIFFRNIAHIHLPRTWEIFYRLFMLSGFGASIVGIGFSIAGIVKKSKMTWVGVFLNWISLLFCIITSLPR